MNSYLWKRPSKTYYAAFFIFIFITLVSRQADAASTYIQNVAFSQDSQGDYISLDWKSIPTDSPSCIRYLVLVFFNRSNPNGTTVGDQYSESSYGDFTASGSGSYSGRGSYAFTSGLPNLSCAQNDSDLSTALPRTIKAYVNPGWEPKKLSFTSNDFITVQLIGYSLGSGYSQILENSTTQYYKAPANPLPVIPYDNVRFGFDSNNKLKVSFDWIGPSRIISPLVGFNGTISYPFTSNFVPDTNKDVSMTWESGSNQNTGNVDWLLQGASISAQKGQHYDLSVNELHTWTPTRTLTVCSWLNPCALNRSQTETVLGRKLNTNDYITIAFVGEAFSGGGYALSDPNKYNFSFSEPVILVPGILGTKLNKALSPFEQVWPGSLLSSPSDRHLDFLQLSNSGAELPNQGIKFGEILDEATSLKRNVYKDIIDKLTLFASSINSNYIGNPYDWRLDISKTAEQLGQKIKDAAALSDSGKVNIVAHSMGGLLTKEYLRIATTTNNINKIIFLGTPNLGAPKAAKLLLYGDDLNINTAGLGLNPDEAKKISQNFPAVYQLLPSKQYLATVFPTYLYGPDGTGLRARLDYDQTKKFLNNFPINSTLIQRAENFHAALDNKPLPKNIDVYNIVGCNNPTISQIILQDNDKKQIEISIGDGTVPLESATWGDNESQRYYSLSKHSNLVKDETALQQIINILSDKKDVLTAGTSKTDSNCDFTQERVEFATHSPVDLHVYDGQGRHLGPDANGDIEYGIPDSSYDTLGDNHFVIVPDSSTTTYRVVIDAYDTGSFDFDITKMNGTSTTEKISYLNQPLLSSSTIATLTYSSGATPTLAIDNEGNGSIDKNVTSTATVTGANTADITPPTIDVTSPDELEYGRNEIITVSAVAADSESGLALFETKFDGFILKDSKIDLIELPLGTHTLNFLAFDKAGNPREITQEFTSYADATSTIAAINRAYNLRWIKNKDTRDDLISDIKEVIKLQKKIIKLEGKLPPAVAKKLTPEQKIRKEIQKLETKIDKKLGKELVKKIESKFKKDLLTIQAFVMLREDIEWMMQ